MGMRELWPMKLRTMFFLGSHPLWPDDENAYVQLMAALWHSFTDCSGIYLKSVLRENWCWPYFTGDHDHDHDHDHEYMVPDMVPGPRKEKSWFVYMERGVQPFHTVSVPDAFEEYLRKFSSKRRYALRREIRILQDRGGGELQLERITDKEQCERFLGIARPLYARTWQGAHGVSSRLAGGLPDLEDLARRGILRSYVLRCGQEYCAFAVGHQFRDVFHLVEIGHEPAFNKYSPGKVLLLLLIEDLTRHARPKRLSLGHGEQAYKGHLGTDHSEDASLMLMRRTLANRLKCGCHQAFRSSVRTVKRWVGRKTFD